MFIRKRNEVAGIQWGNGTSHRMLTEKDGMGFTVAHTVVNAGSESRLQYQRTSRPATASPDVAA